MKYLIAGLGNFGIDYVNTRHNIGFDVVEKLAADKNVVFTSGRYADVAEFKFKGKTFLLIKPTTYMNLSGKAVKYWMDKENIPLENIVVVTDDLNLPLSKLRIRKNGSDGGHNGLKNIQEILQTNQYIRLRFGVGNNFPSGRQVDFVLGKWEKEEQPAVTETVTKAAEAVVSIIMEGVERAMNKFN
ncbi:MAG: aminoacyl-tRNA hydrolase [Bacteroidetes bacterium]|nr:aminoacyl-tRNA hydrolase [Bacteroidota bacterium]